MALPLYYNWRNLLVRKLSTVLTFTLVAVVVAVLAVLLSFAEGIRASLRVSGRSTNVMVMKTGATAESTSIINEEEASRVMQAPGVERNAGGQTLVSRELCVQTTLSRGDGRGIANVAVRGVDPVAFDVHREVRIVDGRRFSGGELEVIVGRAAKQRYAGLSIGSSLALGRTADRVYRVVGVFEAAGGALESEIWALRTALSDSYIRRMVSSAVLRTASAADAQRAIEYIRGPAVRLQAKLETEYYKDLSSKTRDIVILTTALIGLMAIGAVFAVANTLYASVDNRKREIAMLRTIGFQRGAIMLAFVVESLLVCTTACMAGLGASLLVHGSKQDFLSDTTWTVLAYELQITPRILATAIGLSVAVGVIGAVAPALRASRIRVTEALRKA